MLARTGFAAACVLTISATGAAAQNCPPLKQIANIKMEQSKDGRWLIPIKLNGADKKLMLDTSTVPSIIFADYATEAGLTVEDEQRAAPPPGRGGPPAGGRGAAAAGRGAPPPAPGKVAKVDSFVLGSMASNGGYFKVEPDERKDRSVDSNIVGVLGTDILSRQDFDMDFGAKTLGLFSSDHCPGAVQYWQGPTVQVTFYVDAKDHIRFPVLVDGKELSAAMNTASPQNVMSLVYGKRKAGVDVTDAGFEKVATAAGETDKWSKRFKAVDIGGIAIGNPLIVVNDDSKTNIVKMESTAGMHTVQMDRNIPDLVLGAPFLNKLHIYVASKELKMYVTPAVAAP